MIQRLATCSLVVLLGCSPSIDVSTGSGASEATLPLARHEPERRPFEPPLPREHEFGIDGGASVPAPRAPEPSETADEPFELSATPAELEAEIERQGPLAPGFAALSSPVRQAVATFFARGPGAAHGDGQTSSGWLAVTNTAAGGAARARPVIRGDPVPGYPGLYNVTLENTGTGYLEKFLLQVPDVPPAVPVPLLVVFHKYGVSHADALYHTSFVEEARARGWYLVAPLGLSGQNFGSLASQVNVQAALDHVLASPRVDRTRIYGVGFSMGGGGVASYAARHQAPGSARFAAIANHTGTVSLAHAYSNEGDLVRAQLESLFGGPPDLVPFAYLRCSSIDLDPASNTVQTANGMVRNLRHVPIRSWLASNDPQPYLPQQTLAFDAHVQPLHAANELTVVPADVHAWSTLDEAALCDWFAGFSLEEPASGTLLADQDGAWHRFLVEQDQPGDFTAIDWSVSTLQNRIVLGATTNLDRLSIAGLSLGLVYQGVLAIDLSSGDGSGDRVQLLDVPKAPNAVFRNGQPAGASYDAAASTLSFDEPGAAGTQSWTLVF